MSTAMQEKARLTEPVSAEIPPLPPTQDELPCNDGVPMETERHRLQMELLIHAFKPWLDRQGAGYVGGNMFVYFSLAQVRDQHFSSVLACRQVKSFREGSARSISFAGWCFHSGCCLRSSFAILKVLRISHSMGMRGV